MAVYTRLDASAIASLAARYGLGAVKSFHGIAEGVENTNYLVVTENGDAETKTILTLFEKRTKPEELPYFLELMHHLAERGIACPLPLSLAEGGYLAETEGKKAAMVSFLKGSGVKSSTAKHTLQTGEVLAQMHLASMDFKMKRENALSLVGWETLAARINGETDSILPGLDEMIAEELDFLKRQWPNGLTIGTLHADLFPDNVFFDDNRLSGVIDFYFACTDILAYDLAITVCAWCFDDFTEINTGKFRAMMEGYQSIRPLNEGEKQAFVILCRGASLRFLLTRAHDLIFHPEGAEVTPKDPMEYVQKLRFFQQWGGL